MANVGIVICSRSGSQRIPDKPFVTFNGTALIVHLIRRISGDYPIYLAVPLEEHNKYSAITGDLVKDVMVGHPRDPLARMAMVAREKNLDIIVRITHDKIFVDPKEIKRFVEILINSNADYVYSSDFVPGTGFEVIRNEALQKAATEFKDVEHISYAVRAITTRQVKVPLDTPKDPPRLLIDYPQDVVMVRAVFTALGDYCYLEQILKLCNCFKSIPETNQLPTVTVYTCAYNAAKWIEKCMVSVVMQRKTPTFEYVLIDDGSEDNTEELMKAFCDHTPDTIVYRNSWNVGLSSCCSRALSMARGKYIIRLDADDVFSSELTLKRLVRTAEKYEYDVVYPSFFDGDYDKTTHGSVSHHAGGALFNTRALNFVKFTEGLRHHDSFDLWTRLDGRLNVGYHESPTFFYSHREGSMSRSDLKRRAMIKEGIRSAQISGH